MSLIMRKPYFVSCKQRRRRPAFTYIESDQHLCYLDSGTYTSLSLYLQNYKILASLPSLPGWNEPLLIANTEDKFSSN